MLGFGVYDINGSNLISFNTGNWNTAKKSKIRVTNNHWVFNQFGIRIGIWNFKVFFARNQIKTEVKIPTQVVNIQAYARLYLVLLAVKNGDNGNLGLAKLCRHLNN